MSKRMQRTVEVDWPDSLSGSKLKALDTPQGMQVSCYKYCIPQTSRHVRCIFSPFIDKDLMECGWTWTAEPHAGCLVIAILQIIVLW